MKARTEPGTIPILVPSDLGEQHGKAVILCSDTRGGGLDQRHKRVRIFGDADFKNAFARMGVRGRAHLMALILLRDAITRGRREDILREVSKLRKLLVGDHTAQARTLVAGIAWRAGVKSWQDIDKGPKWLRELSRVTFDHMEKSIAGFFAEDAKHIFAAQVSLAVSNAQLVLWWSGTRLIPALFSENHATAAYALVLSGLDWKICPYPKCTVGWFKPDESRQDYCCKAHGDAHRVARWRARQRN